MTESQIREECARRGLALERVGNTWRITGAGVRVVVAHLRHVHPLDLEPRHLFEGRERWKR